MSILNNNVIIVDSHNLCHIAMHGVKNKLSHNEIPTGVIFVFLRQLLLLSKTFHSNQFLFVWDCPREKSYRKQEFPQYKENRKNKKVDEDEKQMLDILYNQFFQLKNEVLPKLGFKNQYEQAGCEGDDLIAMLIRHPSLKIYKSKIIVSTDKDLYQLLDYCDVYNPISKSVLNSHVFAGKYGIQPQVWPYFKSLMGDPSDNIDGISGVGEKTSLKFLLDELDPKSKIYQKIKSPEGEEIAQRNLKLTKLPHPKTKVMKLKDEDLFYEDDFRLVFEEFYFNSFLNRQDFKIWKEQFELVERSYENVS